MKFFENEELSFFNSRKTNIFHSEMKILKMFINVNINAIMLSVLRFIVFDCPLGTFQLSLCKLLLNSLFSMEINGASFVTASKF